MHQWLLFIWQRLLLEESYLNSGEIYSNVWYMVLDFYKYGAD